MAIQKSTDTIHGFTCPEAYYIVTDITYRKNEKVRSRVSIFKDIAGRQNGDITIGGIAVEFDLDLDLESKDNIVVQSYNTLKLLVPDSIDV